MGFTLNTLENHASSGGGLKLLSYKSLTDNKATIIASGYFDEAVTLLSVSDRIMVHSTDADFELAVVGITGAGVVTTNDLTVTASIAAIAAGLRIHGNETYSDTTGAQALGTGAWTKLVNNAAGTLTDDTFKLPASTGVWDDVADEVNFSGAGLVLGDTCLIRVDFVLTTTNPNTLIGVRMKFGVGDVSEYPIQFGSQEVRVAQPVPVVRSLTMTMDNTLTLDNPATIEAFSSAAGDSVVVAGWKFITVPRTPALAP